MPDKGSPKSSLIGVTCKEQMFPSQWPLNPTIAMDITTKFVLPVDSEHKAKVFKIFSLANSYMRTLSPLIDIIFHLFCFHIYSCTTCSNYPYDFTLTKVILKIQVQLPIFVASSLGLSWVLLVISQDHGIHVLSF